MTMLADQPAVTAANDPPRRAAEAAPNGHTFVAEGSTPPMADFLPLDAVIGVGFGIATLTRDGEIVYDEHGDEIAEHITVTQADELAENSPQHDWCIHLIALLEDRHYRRVAKGWWKLYRRGYGLS